MQVSKIKLRMPHDDKVLGIDLDASLHEIGVSLENGVLTIQAGSRVWDAMRRLSGGLVRRTKKQPETFYVDPLAKEAGKAAADAGKHPRVSAPDYGQDTPEINAE